MNINSKQTKKWYIKLKYLINIDKEGSFDDLKIIKIPKNIETSF